MTEDDRFFTWIGKAFALLSFVVVGLLVGYALSELYRADQSYQHDTTPLQAPSVTAPQPKGK